MYNDSNEYESVFSENTISYDSTGNELQRLNTLLHAFWIMFKRP